MRLRPPHSVPVRWLAGALLAILVPIAATAPTAAAAPPPPCGGVAQITDPSGDGHHSSTDVLSAWFSEAAGHLQAVISVRAGTFAPEHDDAQINGSGFVYVFDQAGVTRYVRATATADGNVSYDTGSYTAPNTFTSTGTTTGSVEKGNPGSVVVDVPATSAGQTLTNSYVLTYDGITNGVPDWVDHAPGGDAPPDPSRGADYVVGSCAPAPPPGTYTVPPPVTTTAVSLTARSKLKGGGTATVSGKVVPARAGVPVQLARTANRKTATQTLTTAADGSFTAKVAITETTVLRATAERISSQARTVTVASAVKVKVSQNRAKTKATVVVTIRPALPGRLLWLRSNAVKPSVTKTIRAGSRLTLRLTRPAKGRYQAVFIPSGSRAERSTSNTGVIR